MKPELPTPGHPTYAKLMYPYQTYHAVLGKLVVLATGQRLEVLAINDYTYNFYGKCQVDGYDVIVICDISQVDGTTPESPAEYETRGVEAIVYLQSMAGINEPEDHAMAGWAKMEPLQQEFTLALAHKMQTLEVLRAQVSEELAKLHGDFAQSIAKTKK